MNYYFFNEYENATIEAFYKRCKVEGLFSEQEQMIWDESVNQLCLIKGGDVHCTVDKTSWSVTRISRETVPRKIMRFENTHPYIQVLKVRRRSSNNPIGAESNNTKELVFKGTAFEINQVLKKIEKLYNDPKSHMVSHEIDKPLSEYALQDLKDHCKPFKVEVEQMRIANNRARINFLGKNS